MKKLLVFTQKMDSEDPILGFFCGWVKALAGHFQSVHVVCLEEGKHNLPENVRVYSLGKPHFAKVSRGEGKIMSKIKYVLNFYKHIWNLKKDYGAVFVHMNQEYILLGGVFWKMLSKKIYFWRNHVQGNFLTRLAVWLSDKVFCTSNRSYTARFKKTIIMPAGIDIESFKPQTANRKKNSILSLGRISPIKKPDLLIEALNILKNKEVDFTCDFYGDALPKDKYYFDSLKIKTKEYDLENKVNFYKAVPNYETPKIYNEHEIFVNLTVDGSFDKTIIEAISCGAVPIVSNKSLEGILPDSCITRHHPVEIAQSIQNLLNAPLSAGAKRELDKFSKSQSLSELVDKLIKEI